MTDQITHTDTCAVEDVVSIATHAAASLSAAPQAHVELDDLTTQERRIARRLLRGDGPKQVGFAMEISTRTVYWHQTNVYRKTGARSLGEFFAWAYRHRECCGFAALFERASR